MANVVEILPVRYRGGRFTKLLPEPTPTHGAVDLELPFRMPTGEFAEMIQYLRVRSDASGREWLDKMHNAYRRQGYLTDRQACVVADIARQAGENITPAEVMRVGH